MSGAAEAHGERVDLAALTGARGLAAWFVVLYHIRPGLSGAADPWLMAVLGKGYLAVDFFFMLSGFVLWMTYGDRLRSHGWRAVPQFLGRRVARILPLHLFILACAVAFALLLDGAGKRDPAQYPWEQLPLHILLLQNWGFTNALSWNDPAWSISCEWAAYLLFPLLTLAADWRRLPSVLLVAIIVAAGATLHLLMASNGAATLGRDIPRFGLPRALVEFVIGTIVCALWQRWHDQPGTPAIAAFITAAMLFALSATGAAAETLGVPLLFAALLLGLALTASSASNPLASRPLVYLGEISYATYLVHFLLYVAFKLLFVTDLFAVPHPTLVGFLLLTLVVSALLHRLLELPAQAALRRVFERVPKERCPAPAL